MAFRLLLWEIVNIARSKFVIDTVVFRIIKFDLRVYDELEKLLRKLWDVVNLESRRRVLSFHLIQSCASKTSRHFSHFYEIAII